MEEAEAEEGKSIGQGGASCGIQSFIGSPRLIQLIGWKAGRELLYCNSLSEFSLLAAFLLSSKYAVVALSQLVCQSLSV